MITEDWMPIETAPKDGSLIFVYSYYEPFDWHVYGTSRWVSIHGVDGWLSRGLFDPPGDLGLGNPTHWKPMLKPPKK